MSAEEDYWADVLPVAKPAVPCCAICGSSGVLEIYILQPIQPAMLGKEQCHIYTPVQVRAIQTRRLRTWLAVCQDVRCGEGARERGYLYAPELTIYTHLEVEHVVQQGDRVRIGDQGARAGRGDHQRQAGEAGPAGRIRHSFLDDE